MRIHFYSLSRAFSNLCGYGESDRCLGVDGRPKRIKTYTDLNVSALVWTGPYSVPLGIVHSYMLVEIFKSVQNVHWVLDGGFAFSAFTLFDT